LLLVKKAELFIFSRQYFDPYWTLIRL